MICVDIADCPYVPSSPETWETLHFENAEDNPLKQRDNPFRSRKRMKADIDLSQKRRKQSVKAYKKASKFEECPGS